MARYLEVSEGGADGERARECPSAVHVAEGGERQLQRAEEQARRGGRRQVLPHPLRELVERAHQLRHQPPAAPVWQRQRQRGRRRGGRGRRRGSGCGREAQAVQPRWAAASANAGAAVRAAAGGDGGGSGGRHGRVGPAARPANGTDWGSCYVAVNVGWLFIGNPGEVPIGLGFATSAFPSRLVDS